MQTTRFNEFIKKTKLEYNKIGLVICPAFNNEPVYFGRYGFNHLIRKDRKRRTLQEQIVRIMLVNNAPYIIRTTKIHSVRIDHQNNHTALFWSFVAIINDVNITIIVRQLDKHKKHFFSIFENLKSKQIAHKPQ